MYPIIKEFLDLVYSANPRQKKSIESTMSNHFKEEDYKQLNSVLDFYMQSYSIEDLANAYNLIVEDTAAETKFYIINGHYRYSSFDETEKLVYSNSDYMSKYMVGLAISGYLWTNHILIFHWFQKIMFESKGERYLEIGPGHGRYFYEAVKAHKFEHYDAIDVSKTSVDQTNSFLAYFLNVDSLNIYNVFLQDAYKYNPDVKYDFIVIAEVMEHLEDPEKMFKKIYEISNPNAYLYVTVPINAPAIDHIFLFKTIDEVEDMIRGIGFEIEDRLYAPAGDMELEKAIKKKNSILVGVLARKIN